MYYFYAIGVTKTKYGVKRKMGKELEDNLWVDEVLNGKTEFFARLVDRYKDRVFALVIGLLKQKEDAEEITQDIFVKIFRALPKFQRKAKFSTWLYRIAYNECISRLRKKKVYMMSVENTNTNGLVSYQESSEQWQEAELQSKLLQKALNKLAESERALVHYFYFEDLTVDEICQINGLTASNVKTKLFRIRKKLFKEMAVNNNNILA